MKKRLFVLCLAVMVITAVMSAGCKSTPNSGTGKDSAIVKFAVRTVYIDYQGAVTGSKLPEWIDWAVNRDLESIKRMPRFQGRVPFVEEGYGQNLDLLRSWVNNFNAQAGVSRRIANYIEADFGGAQRGQKEIPEKQEYIKEMVATFSNVKFSGLAKEMDYWVKVRVIDTEKKTEKEEYRYYVVYSMAEADLQYQIDLAMGKITAKNQEQAELKRDVEEALKQVRFNGIQQSTY